MKYSLKTKLSLSYVAIILVCVSIVSILANIILERQFKDYVMKQQEHNELELLQLIEQRYNATNDWDVRYLEDIGMNALENGMIIKILDQSNNLVWDAEQHNDGMCQQMLDNMRVNMQSRYSKNEGGYAENTYLIKADSQIIGSIVIGYYGPYFYTDSDLNFINTINRLLIFTGLISIILALFLGVFISRQISKPISRVIHKAAGIAEGSYGERIFEESNTKEINELVQTVNNLAETLKKQESLSKQASLDIAHELRTPLTTVQGNLEAILDGVMDLDTERINVMHQEILRINRLVDDLGKLSKYESEALKLNKTEFDVYELIEQVVKSVESDFIKENKEISFNGQSQVILADRDKINQVMVNLIANAKKFTSEDGKVEISISTKDDRTQIIIKDNGIGISEKDLPMLFERFYRADKSRSRRSGGAGIGLTIVKTIIDAHGGDIKISSNVGQGTIVTIII